MSGRRTRKTRRPAKLPEPARDPKRRFDTRELKMIQLAVSDLHEFYAGYVHVERLRKLGLGARNPALDRFFEGCFTLLLDGLYPADRNRGLVPVLKLVNCGKLMDEIVEALDCKVGTSTFAEIQNRFRDIAIAHPHYTASHMAPIVEHFQAHLSNDEDVEIFSAASRTLKKNTAALYIFFKKAYPEIVAHADAIE